MVNAKSAESEDPAPFEALTFKLLRLKIKRNYKILWAQRYSPHLEHP